MGMQLYYEEVVNPVVTSPGGRGGQNDIVATLHVYYVFAMQTG